jgi:hypothetical protein
MFAIFEIKQGARDKRISERVSTLEIAYELLRRHKEQNPDARFQVKAEVRRTRKDGSTSLRANGKPSMTFVSIPEYEKILNEAESGSLF